jgi:hypothetical protein
MFKSSLVFMVEPAAFFMNLETSETNAFQKESDKNKVETQVQALSEFQHVVTMLQNVGVRVHVVKDREERNTPDSIFPNNWVSFHQDGSAYLYPMCTANRRRERALNIVLDIVDEHQLRLNQIIDMSFEELYGRYLEGTGSIVFDHKNKLAYACHSERMHEDILDRVCKLLGYKPIVFSAQDDQGTAIYHTNVLMAMGEDFVVICLESIANVSERNNVLSSLTKTNKEVIDISYDQMHHFCGNVLALFGKDGNPVLAMSSSAYEHFTEIQRRCLAKHANLIQTPIPMIEQCGGGSVRCMICEVGLPVLSHEH